MTTFPGFTAADFDAFEIPTLEGRMAAIKAGPRPKLEALGGLLAPGLSSLVGRAVYPIVAKHARRTVNPPNDTWVAWSTNPRGYKMLPHFQTGLWQTHAFVQAGVIYESGARPTFAGNLLAGLPEIRAALPPDYRWLEDHTLPQGIRHADMTDEDFHRIADKLRNQKHSDCMVGLSIPRAQAIAAGPTFADHALTIFQTLVPIYRLGSLPEPT